MSRIGNALVALPHGVDVTFNNSVVTVKGKLGELKQDILEGITVDVVENNVVLKRTGKTTSVNDLATMFHERFENQYNFIDDQMGNVRKSILVNNDAYERLGWIPQRNLVDYIISL